MCCAGGLNRAQRFPCPLLMLTRQVVLLTPSKSTHLQELLFYKINPSLTYLESILLRVFILKGGLMVNQLFLPTNHSASPLHSQHRLVLRPAPTLVGVTSH